VRRATWGGRREAGDVRRAARGGRRGAGPSPVGSRWPARLSRRSRYRASRSCARTRPVRPFAARVAGPREWPTDHRPHGRSRVQPVVDRSGQSALPDRSGRECPDRGRAPPRTRHHAVVVLGPTDRTGRRHRLLTHRAACADSDARRDHRGGRGATRRTARPRSRPPHSRSWSPNGGRPAWCHGRSRPSSESPPEPRAAYGSSSCSSWTSSTCHTS
jgi:hypothetical protein